MGLYRTVCLQQAMDLTAESIALRPAEFYKEHSIELQMGKQV